LLHQRELRFSMQFARRISGETLSVDDSNLDFLGFYRIERPNPSNQRLSYQIVVRPDDNAFVNGGEQWETRDVRIQLAEQLSRKIYRFQAERFSLGECPSGFSSILSPNATNLPAVLNVLASNPARLQRLNQLITEILPQVRHVSVRPIANNRVEILVW